MNQAQKNALFFKQLNIDLGDFNGEEEISTNADIEDESLEDWANKPVKAYLHPPLFLTEKAINHYQTLVEDLDQNGSPSQYLGMTDNDPHFIWAHQEIRKNLIDVGIDPENQSTTLNFRPSVALFLGSGDGNLIQEVVNQIRPFHLFIAFRDANDLISSFSKIDWCELWNNYCNSKNSKIAFIPYEEVKQICDQLLLNNFVSIDHMPVFVPDKGNSNKYISDRDELINGDHLKFHCDYLGFMIDEYNMTWNSALNLQCQPRLYRKPKQPLGGKYIICGSGPSLDQNIDQVKRLSNEYIIVASASNYRTLRKNGIDVDVLVLLERGAYEYDNYLSVVSEYGVGSTKLFCSVTCDSRLHSLFEESMVYFRAALSPVSIFCFETRQVLELEGPQTINASAAMASFLGADEVVFVGVDLGAKSLDKVRSDSAVGLSERNFNIEREGNFCEKVYTSKLLVDGCIALEMLIQTSPQTRFYNSSDGLMIKGALPRLISDMPSEHCEQEINSKTRLNSWWKKQYKFSNSDLRAFWDSTRPRAQVSETINSIKQSIASDQPWFPIVQNELVSILGLSKPIRYQLGVRMLKALILKYAIIVTRELYVCLCQDPMGDSYAEFERKSRQAMIALCDRTEKEIYAFFDMLESKIYN